jgi:hypothetical protein
MVKNHLIEIKEGMEDNKNLCILKESLLSSQIANRN